MNILGIALLVFQSQLGTASGIVTKPGGIQPLSGAMLTLSPVSNEVSLPPGVILSPGVPNTNPRVRTAISQDDGRFSITDIEPGQYRLQVQSPRFGSAAYGQLKPNGPGAILNISGGQRLSDLKISMVPTGTIAGRITGRSGEPIVNANVQAMKFVYQEGRRVLAMVQATTTDDRGDYRLFWLTSGKYVVVAAPRGSSLSTGTASPIKPGETVQFRDLVLSATAFGLISDALLDGTNLVRRILEDGTVQEESWLPTYYPSTNDPSQAAAVEVALGSTVPGINITLGSSPVQKIRGRVTGVSPGNQATVALAYGARGTVERVNNRAASTIDGSFEFAGIVPGSYYLSARDRTGLAARPVAVVVGDRDVEGVSIGLVPSGTLSVRITAEGVTPGPLDPLTGITVTLQPDIGPMNSVVDPLVPRSAPLVPGTNVMSISNVPPGDYQLNISQGPLRENLKRLYIKSVSVGREDALGTITVSSDTTNLVVDVVLTTSTGSAEGVALGRNGEPAANVTVVLVPTHSRKRTSLYQALVTGSDGKYRFQEIPPGEYKLFAWDEVENGAWQNAEYIGPYESRGRAVRVSENSKEDVQLSVIYNP